MSQLGIRRVLGQFRLDPMEVAFGIKKSGCEHLVALAGRLILSTARDRSISMAIDSTDHMADDDEPLRK